MSLPFTLSVDEIIGRASLTRMADEERDRAILILAGAARKYLKAGDDITARRIEGVLERIVP